ncbi:MAG TPA: hypothetical protein VFK89_12185, partial [Actinomycetota bacterium]|nr:hypothetical protein [Actinomycetota bacterium]
MTAARRDGAVPRGWVTPSAVDAGIVALLIAAGLLEQFGGPHLPGESTSHVVAHVAVVVGSITPLLLRRRFPMTTLIVMALVIGIAGSIGPFLSLNPSAASAFALVFATFNATATGASWQGIGALALCWVAASCVLRPWITPVAAWLPTYLPPVVAFVAGRAQSRRSVLGKELERRVDEEETHHERLKQLELQEARASLAAE